MKPTFLTTLRGAFARSLLLSTLAAAAAACVTQASENADEGTGAIEAQTPAKNDGQATVAANKKVVLDFFSAFNAGDVDRAFRNVVDKVEWWVPGARPEGTSDRKLDFAGTTNKAGYLQVVAQIKEGFPQGLRLEVQPVSEDDPEPAMLAEGDRVAVEVHSLGKHVSGKIYQNRYHFLFTIKGGKIVAVKEYMDTLHLYNLLNQTP